MAGDADVGADLVVRLLERSYRMRVDAIAPGPRGWVGETYVVGLVQEIGGGGTDTHRATRLPQLRDLWIGDLRPRPRAFGRERRQPPR